LQRNEVPLSNDAIRPSAHDWQSLKKELATESRGRF
jgi:hypothetical protein